MTENFTGITTTTTNVDGRLKMQYNESEYEAAVNKWFEELKDIVTNDLLRQHINKYPVKSDYEIEEEDDKDCDSNERHTVDN
jgi:hypothetical protein